MAFEMYQDVILTRAMPAHGLCAGDIGTLVERHVVPNAEVGYSVEFFDMTGKTVAVITVGASHLRVPTSEDVPNARKLAAVGPA